MLLFRAKHDSLRVIWFLPSWKPGEFGGGKFLISTRTGKDARVFAEVSGIYMQDHQLSPNGVIFTIVSSSASYLGLHLGFLSWDFPYIYTFIFYFAFLV